MGGDIWILLWIQ